MSRQYSNNEEYKKLPNLISYYEICNRSEGKSAKTVSWYSSNLKRFYHYLEDKHLSDSIDQIDIRLLREYVLYLLKTNKLNSQRCNSIKAERLSPATVHGHVRTLRAFFSWLEREEFTEKNLAISLKPPRVPERLVSPLSDEEIRAIFETFNYKNACDARNQTIFMILLDTGVRIGELINLKLGDLHLKEGFFKVLGKGQKERIVPIGNNAQRALQKYLYRYRPEPANTWIENVFLSIHGDFLTENSMKLMFARLAQTSGVQRLHAHLCRHTFATRFLINGGDIFTLQQILGHSTLEMVRHYANLASSHIVMQHQRFSPLDRLNLRKA